MGSEHQIEMFTLREEKGTDLENNDGAGRRLQQMFDSKVEGLIAINNDGKITEVNEAQIRMLGANSRDDVVGKHISVLFAGKDRDRVAFNIAKALTEKQNIAKASYNFATVDGNEFPGELSVVVVFSASGEMVGFLGFVKQM